MLGLISCCLDPDLEFTRLFSNFLGRCQINACKVDQDITFPYSPDWDVFQAKGIELIIKDIPCKISRLSTYSFFVT